MAQTGVVFAAGVLARLQFVTATILVMRNLDPVANGEIQLALFIGALLAIFSEFGLRGYGLREVAKISDQLEACSRLIANIVLLRVTGSILLFLALGFFFLWVPIYSSKVQILILGFTAFWILDGMSLLLKSLFRALGHVSPDLYGSLTSRTLVLIGVSFALFWTGGSYDILAAFLFGAFVEVVFLLFLLQKRLRPFSLFQFHPKDYGSLLRNSIPFFVFIMFGMIHMRLGPGILSIQKFFPGAENPEVWAELILKDIGAFAAAFRFPEALQFLPVALSGVLVPALIRMNTNGNNTERMEALSLRLSLLIGLVMSSLLVIFKASFAEFLGAGKFSGYPWTFWILGVWTSFVFFQLMLTNVLIARGMVTQLFEAYTIMVLVNALVTMLGIIAGMQAGAPALGLLAGEVIAVLLLLKIYVRNSSGEEALSFALLVMGCLALCVMSWLISGLETQIRGVEYSWWSSLGIVAILGFCTTRLLRAEWPAITKRINKLFFSY